jgi:3-phenylpropionate/trans-cinnamate dioxygenase ferredoxin subunit
MPFITACLKSALPPGQAHCFNLGGKRIAIFNQDGKYLAFDDECTHEGAPLSEGRLVTDEAGRCVVECPMHLAHFDVLTGAVTELPADTPINIYPVRVQGEEVQVETER